MLARSSVWPIVTGDKSCALHDSEEEIDRVSPDPEEEVPDEFRGRRKLVRRRANRVQGRSLEVLGHAVEYLVDSRMFVVDARSAGTEREAVQILMRLSRMVFLECDEAVPVWTKMTGIWKRPNDHAQALASHASGGRQL